MKPYDHIYLSPHFDDAALSCGGTIHQQGEAGQAVLVVTICAARPRRALSPLAQKIHAAMGGADDLVGTRRQEDREAVNRLGADLVWLDFPDGLYRGVAEAWYYLSISALFGPIHPGDVALAEAIASAIEEHAPGGPRTTLYAPLAVGRHVDHQLAHRAAWALRAQGWRVVFYEDYPYADPAYRLPFDEKNIATLGATLAGLAKARLTPRLVRLSEDDLQARIDSVRAYRSQVPLLFDDAATMAARTRAFASDFDAQGPAERFWIPG